MKEVSEIIRKAQKGAHPACNSCSRNPQNNNTAFAYSCEEHFGIKKNGLIVMLRDPGASDGGASHSGVLCPFHNNDKTANVLKTYFPNFKIPYSSIYILNSILHGYFDENSKKNNTKERLCCSMIIEELFHHLAPKVVLALGVEALKTSLKILGGETGIKPTIIEMKEKYFYYGKYSKTYVFGMPHPAYAGTNFSKIGLIESDVWISIIKKINKIWLTN